MSGLLTGLAAGVASGVVGNAFSTLLSRKKGFYQIFDEQQRLNEDAARINYKWGERAAENAFIRQMQMYEKTMQDNSFAARRKQMEDAGLSVGLMYGQAGQGGGGAGSLGGGTQGATGGAKAGDAATIYGMALQKEQLQLQRIATIADANLKNAQAENLGANTKTTEDSREAILAGLKETARGQWIANNLEQFGQWLNKENTLGNTPFKTTWTDKFLGTFEARAESLTTAKAVAPVVEAMTARATGQSQIELNAANQALTDRKTSREAQALMIDLMMLEVARQNAAANQTQAAAAIKNAATNRLQYSLNEYLASYGVKLTNMQIEQLANSIYNQNRITDFNTGGWAKAAIGIGGLKTVGSFIVGGALAKAAGMNATAALSNAETYATFAK